MKMFSGKIEQFPPFYSADEDGLIAVGGDYSIHNILLAYCNGIFPWELGPEPYWYCPQPRYLIRREEFTFPKRIMKTVKKSGFSYSINHDFQSVIESCSKMARNDQFGTWIYPEVMEKFQELHQMGYAHSVEVWQNDQLVGGLYGLGIGKVFCGESMFHTVSDASKCAAAIFFYFLFTKLDIQCIDCQMESPIMKRLGGQYFDVQDLLMILPKRQELVPWTEISGRFSV